MWRDKPPGPQCENRFTAGSGGLRYPCRDGQKGNPVLVKRVDELPQAQVLMGTTRHTRWARISHWIVTANFLALALSGFVILMCHPRLYWGEVGNDLTPALFELPISRNYQHGGWEESVPFFADTGFPVSAIRTY